MAVGIKSPLEYSYQNSGYAYIETTLPDVITDSESITKYLKLDPNPQILVLAEGKSFDSVSMEFQEAEEWNRLWNTISSRGYYQEYEYKRLEAIAHKYGIDRYIHFSGTGINCRYPNCPRAG